MPYLLAPGDRLEIIVHSAPELSRTVTIAPDGRFHMPYTGSISTTEATVEDVRARLRDELSGELNDPDVDVLLLSTAPRQVFVGGEVRDPGIFALPGQIDPFQAIIMAGGTTSDARTSKVLLMRRSYRGEPNSRVIDLDTILNADAPESWGPLQPFDVIYVTRKPIADQNRFVRQYIRDALPFGFLVFYDIADGNS